MEIVTQHKQIFNNLLSEASVAGHPSFSALNDIYDKISAVETTDDEELAELISEIIPEFQTLFTSQGISKWSSKVLKKKAYKSVDGKLGYAIAQLRLSLTLARILTLSSENPEPMDLDEQTNDMLILWVDDAHDNNKQERQKAIDEFGIKFELVTSTAEAVQWIDAHPEYQNASPKHFRVITDWFRPDERDSAAESLVTSIRSRKWQVPVLIYCNEKTDTADVLVGNTRIASTWSDILLHFYWASMAVSDFSTFPAKKTKAAAAKKSTSKSSSSSNVKSTTQSSKHEEDVETGEKKMDIDLDNVEAEQPVPAKKTKKIAKKAATAIGNSPPKKHKEDEEKIPMVAAGEVSDHKDAELKPEIPSTVAIDDIASTKASEIPNSSQTAKESDRPTNGKKTSSKAKKSSSDSKPQYKMIFALSDDDLGDEFEASMTKKPASPKKQPKKAADMEDEDFDPEEAEKHSISRMPTEIMYQDADDDDDGYDLLNSKEKKPSKAKSTSKPAPKDDWTAKLANRAVPKLLLDEKDENDSDQSSHLLATPPPKKTVAKKSKSANQTSPGAPDHAKGSPQRDASSITPKTLAPTGPAPPKTWNALDDDMEVDPQLSSNAGSHSLTSSAPTSSQQPSPHFCKLLGIYSDLRVGALAEFMLEARDSSDKRLMNGGAQVNVSFQGPIPFQGFVEDSEDGIYSIKCFPIQVGLYRLSVTVNGAVLKGCPFEVDVQRPLAKKKSLMFVEDSDEDDIITPMPPKKIHKTEEMEEDIPATINLSSLPEPEVKEADLEPTQIF